MVIIFAVFVGITLDLACAKPAVQYYASKYDSLDVETVLNNRRMVNYYSACLISKGPCPPEGTELKRILPEALQTNCARCTEKQATITLRAIKRLKKEYPKIWKQLSEKWDPDDVYINKFESTFGSRFSPPKSSVVPQPVIANRFDGNSNDEPSSNNNIDGSFPLTSTTSRAPTTHKVITTTNRIQPSSTIITSTSLVSQTKKTTKPSISFSSSTSSTFKPSTTRFTTTTELSTSQSPSTTRYSPSTTTPSRTTPRQSPISGFVPLNTFFTNPPRPLINLNGIGVNIGATVKAIKQVEKVVAGIAMDKLEIIRKILLPPWRKQKRKYS